MSIKGLDERVGDNVGLQGTEFIGRETELRALSNFRDSLLSGRSDVLVIRGDAGIGKSAVIQRFLAEQQACRVESCAGVESEIELAWAGLHQFCVPLLDRLDQIPAPQRAALEAAFGLSAAPAPDPFLIGLAVLSLIADAAERRPMIYVVDDAYALDRASLRTLAFLARRLHSESVGVVFVVRDVPDELSGFTQLDVGGLSNSDAESLLDSVLPMRLDSRVRERIIAETAGNPLAIIELAQHGPIREFAGGYGTPAGGDVRHWLEGSFIGSFSALPGDVQRLLLLAAADPTGDPALLRRAAHVLGIDMVEPGDEHVRRLVAFTPQVRFRHPLIRSAIYGACGQSERHSTHRALAEATDPNRDPERRAWHLGQSQDQPDENIADELERSAARALTRGGFAGAAAFQARAAQLTADPRHRAHRQLVAATASFQSGDSALALELLDSAEAHDLDDRLKAQAEMLRGQVSFFLNRSTNAPELLLHAARRLEIHDPALAREAYLDAMCASFFIGTASTVAPRSVASITLAQAPPARQSRPTDFMLDAAAARQGRGVAAATRPAMEARQAALEEWPPSVITNRNIWVAVCMAVETLDSEAAVAIADRQVEVARERGALLSLPMALVPLATAHMLRGNIGTGESLASEADEIAADVGVPVPRWPLLLAAALRGDSARFGAIADVLVPAAQQSGAEHIVHFAHAAQAVLDSATGQYRVTLERGLQYAADGPPERLHSSIIAFEFIEAASRIADAHESAAIRGFVVQLTSASTSGWARGLRSLAEILLGCASDPEVGYRETIGHFRGSGMAVYEARSHLLFGEWLRREGRRSDSRAELGIGLTMMSHMGLRGFEARTVRELELAGDTNARRRPATNDDELTPQELQVAQLAAAGLSNREIGERLFLSHRTVGSHLYRVYPKLGITSRNQLNRALAEQV